MSPEVPHISEHEPKHPRLIFTSHVDIVHPHVRWRKKEGNLVGSLDDMLPSAILVSVLPQLKGEPRWTEDEETKMLDAKKLARWIVRSYPQPKGMYRHAKDRSWLPRVCVLEVSDIHLDCDVSFENFVFMDTKKIRQMMSQPHLGDITYAISGRGGGDETFRMAEEFIPSFSLALPIFGDMHTFKSYVPIERIEKYKRVLLEVDKLYG